MPHPRLAAIVRQFPENGLKLMLEDPLNLRDLLLLTGTDLVDLIDFDRLKPLPATFVERDYRHVESDLVLRGPLRRRRGARLPRGVLVYVLLEHQSEPDRLMPLRMIEYVVQVFKAQTREWAQRHASFAGLRLHPVLPVVFYTGLRRWDGPGRFADLVELGERFGRLTPALEPLFVNLGATPPGRLEAAGGFFGRVLRLVQQRRARPAEFRALLRRVVRHLEAMPAAERLRWLELLSYIHALVYHDRNPSERPGLQRAIEASVATDEHRQEVDEMRRTIADELRDEGEVRGSRRNLIRMLRRRFGELPPEIVATVEATDDLRQLEKWLDRILTATSLAEMGIGPARR